MNDQFQGELAPLAITCTSTDCTNDLHCFKQTRNMKHDEIGHCRECGIDLVAWDRVHERNLGDVRYTFSSLQKELIRHHFWHTEIDQYAINHALRKGRIGIRERVEIELHNKVGVEQPFRDGIQTPKEGNIIYYAQHALACCCRSCLEYWHGIPKGRALEDEELEYLIELVMLYINERMPELKEYGQKVSPIRKTTEK